MLNLSLSNKKKFMLGFSFGELVVVSVVALLALKPKELKALVRSWRKLSSQIQQYYQNYLSYFNEAFKEESESEAEDESDIVNYILDLDGNIQKTYDLSKIMPDLKRNADD
ncbi:hypothetical protein I862_01625 [endosymbiont of Acanthamoeba sp. UWC8]|uniref:hypothetical protein n=1 Tax=endosymbiont of Acanthamoeba sp. UWC8 TaxID=86106 RepID=UPI0004D1DDC3|nr:hypothetical protein [endosymbiont of Acanthamoeba sp. UWC8]AIF80888.1 hypothetical protein I862_01625 [endosymbiont of Acanthamoeba sp. UWC8]